MRRYDRTWDVRCPKALIHFFPERKGYWFKVSRKQAKKLVRILAKAYRVRAPKIADTTPRHKNGHDNGWYVPSERTMYIWPRAHVKTVFHEFYHHLDEVTNEYDSNDNPPAQLVFGRRRETPDSYGWQFAEKLFDVVRTFRPDSTPTKDPAKEFLTMAKKVQEIAHAKRLSAAEEAEAKKELMTLVRGNAAAAGKKAVLAAAAPPPEPTKKGKAKAAPTAKVSAPKGGKERKITFVEKKNPRKEGTKGAKTFALYKVGMTETQFREACRTHGGDPGYMKPDERAGSVKWSE